MVQYIKKINRGLPKKLCQNLIAKFTADTAVRDDPQPDYSTRCFLKLNEAKNWEQELNECYEQIERITSEYFAVPPGWENIAQPEWGDDGLVMAHYRPGDACIMHVDGQSCSPPNNYLRLATLLFFLNDVSDGGELEFPLQKKSISPKEGTAVIFPPHHQFPHCVNETNQDRYVLQTWIIDPSLIVIPADRKNSIINSWF